VRPTLSQRRAIASSIRPGTTERTIVSLKSDATPSLRSAMKDPAASVVGKAHELPVPVDELLVSTTDCAIATPGRR
jgi:hypothetical protein